MTSPETYAAVAMQLTARSVEQCASRDAMRDAVLSHIAEVEGQVRASTIFIQQYIGLPVRLVVLPEYLFTSYPGRISVADFADRVAFAPDGPEYAAIGQVAVRLGTYLAVNAYETDAHFPGLYFQACVIFAPDGSVALRYRRLNSMFAPTPHDVWDRYLEIYGIEAVFPVADTPIGRLAAIASEEILYPEIARALALRGAEVFVHCSSEIGSGLATPKAIARRARAIENMAWLVSANTAGISGTAAPLASADGNSQVIDFKGAVLAESNSGETFTAFAAIDIAAQRAARRKPGMTNLLSRQRTALFASAYAADTHQRANGLIDGTQIKIPDRDYFLRASGETIARLDKDGLI
jgi:predicted amidohydrolase